MKKFILMSFIPLILLLFSGCDKSDSNKSGFDIRLKTGSGLNNGATIFFLALSQNENFMEHPDVFAYDKTDADWYIDGGTIPFTTDYKKFLEPDGEYYYLLKASGVALSGRKTIESEKQTWSISAEPIYYGGPSSINIEIEYP
ncbi:hypothetical protein ACFL4H_01050 [Candidatus Neomarinimicrobiota bacterium]